MQLSRLQLKHDSRRVAHVASRLQEHMALYGYELVETPIIDSANLFLTSAGDQIITRLFTFDRHGQQLALRAEFTAPAAFRYITENGEQTPTARWQFSGAVFEDDPYDMDRRYQRYSVGAELIGLHGAAAEAEIIGMAAAGLSLLGVESWRILIGHVGLMRHLLGRYRLHPRTERFLLNHRSELKDPTRGKDYVLSLLDRHLAQQVGAHDYPAHAAAETQGETIGGRTPQEITRRLREKRQRLTEHEQIVEALNFLERWSAVDGDAEAALQLIEAMIPRDDQQALGSFAEWQGVFELLEAYDVPMKNVVVRPDLARAWDYYTGIVFELQALSGQLGGGGRYDELARIVGGKRSTPAVGFAYYFEQLLDAVPQIALPRERFVTVSAQSMTAGVRWAHRLRKHKIPVTLASPGDEVGDIVVDSEGRAYFRGQVYALEEIARLVTDLGWERA